MKNVELELCSFLSQEHIVSLLETYSALFAVSGVDDSVVW